MIKREWSNWLNGGVFAAIVFIVVSLISLIIIIIQDGSNISLLTDSQFLLTTLVEIAFYFIIGAIVGQIFGRKKSKK